MSDGNVDYRRADAVCASVTKEADSNQPGGKCHLRPSPGHASYFKRNTRTIRLCIRVFHKSDFYQGGVMKKLISFVVDRKSTRLNSSHRCISYAVFCLKKKK